MDELKHFFLHPSLYNIWKHFSFFFLLISNGKRKTNVYLFVDKINKRNIIVRQGLTV